MALARLLALLAMLVPAAAFGALEVVSSSSSTAMLVREIAGEHARLTVLAPPDRDLHLLQVRPITEAAAPIGLDDGFDAYPQIALAPGAAPQLRSLRIGEMHREGLATRFVVQRPGGGAPLPVTLNMPGRHNVLNALATIAVADELRVERPTPADEARSVIHFFDTLFAKSQKHVKTGKQGQ